MLQGLYLIADGSLGESLADKVAGGLIGGARTVLFRGGELRRDEQRAMALKLRSLCLQHDALFLVSDDPELVRDINADGVHLEERDLSVSATRRILGYDGKVIGISVTTVDEALKAEHQGVDYLGIGSTSGREQTSYVHQTTLKTLTSVRKALHIPLVAFGDMTPELADQALGARADAVAVASAILGDSDPARAAREFSLLFNRRQYAPKGRVLTINRLTTDGVSGIEEDIKTITLLGSTASAVVTDISARSEAGEQTSYFIHTDFVESQVLSIIDRGAADIVRIGVLNWGGIVSRVADMLKRTLLLGVVDTPLVDEQGIALLDDKAQDILLSRLLPQTYLLMPRAADTALLTGIMPATLSKAVDAQQMFQQLGVRNLFLRDVMIGQEKTDILFYGEKVIHLPPSISELDRIPGASATLAAAVTAFLSQGFPLTGALDRARQFIAFALDPELQVAGQPPVIHHLQAALRLFEKTPDS
jgi:hydroxymethylpyrimidine kinase/phosphomethylpyrimidine kinase/thiamine-phosphate diphosphorylase